jgi:hypothetical protein
MLLKFQSVDYVVTCAGTYLHEASDTLESTHVMMLKIYGNLVHTTKVGLKLFKLLFSANIDQISLLNLFESLGCNRIESHLVYRLCEKVKFCLVWTGELFLIFLKPVVSVNKSTFFILQLRDLWVKGNFSV